MKYFFVVNPKAGSGEGLETLQKTIESLPEKDMCEVYFTRAVQDATRYVKKCIADNPGEDLRFIACGGDGTISEVFNGAVGADNVSVTCYPCGSGNDFVKAFGGAGVFSDVEKLLHAETRPLDLLKVGDRYSNNVVNFGFDTTVAITVNEDREKTGHGSKSSYTKGILKALIKSMKNEAKIYADGELLNPDGVFMLCTVANGQYVGGSFKCAPRARTDDGLIEVCLVKTISRLRVPKIIGIYSEGRHLEDPVMKDIVVYRQAKKVEVDAPEGFAYSLDGEIIYENHFTVEMVPGAIKLAVPAE